MSAPMRLASLTYRADHDEGDGIEVRVVARSSEVMSTRRFREAMETLGVDHVGHYVYCDATPEMQESLASLLVDRGLPVPVKAISNMPATVVYWEDGTRTVAKADVDDCFFDGVLGFMLCALRKLSRNRESTDEWWDRLWNVRKYLRDGDFVPFARSMRPLIGHDAYGRFANSFVRELDEREATLVADVLEVTGAIIGLVES